MLWKQVIGFFTIIMTLLIVNFVCNMVFYIEFDSNDSDETAIDQEIMVSTITYIHSSMDILFNAVLLVFLISQANDSSPDLPMMPPEQENLLLNQVGGRTNSMQQI